MNEQCRWIDDGDRKEKISKELNCNLFVVFSNAKLKINFVTVYGAKQKKQNKKYRHNKKKRGNNETLIHALNIEQCAAILLLLIFFVCCFPLKRFSNQFSGYHCVFERQTRALILCWIPCRCMTRRKKTHNVSGKKGL